jgi:hypothetical protein
MSPTLAPAENPEPRPLLNVLAAPQHQEHVRIAPLRFNMLAHAPYCRPRPLTALDVERGRFLCSEVASRARPPMQARHADQKSPGPRSCPGCLVNLRGTPVGREGR